MVNITALINGQPAIAWGQVVIAPRRILTLCIDTYRLQFQFKDDDGDQRFDMDTINNEIVITGYNLPLVGSAFNLGGIDIGGRSCTISFTTYGIGTDNPHRTVSYTVFPEKSEPIELPVSEAK